MRIAYDFHIHSGLSPCSCDDMSPNNIINMALLKGLDAIAITDHNSTLNLGAFQQLSINKNLLIVPGVEVTTKEEVHLLCLFESFNNAKGFQYIIDSTLPKINNSKSFFGNQLIYDHMDQVVDKYPLLLISALSLTVEEVVAEVSNLKGVVIPAHIDRKSYSILSNLGFISPNLKITTVEITTNCNISSFQEKHKYLRNYRKIINSDAHSLVDILERESYLEVKDLSCESIINELKSFVI
ncbi:PHP domain-containing protein [Alkaliphilus pronyensis]|uniref:PHP domain-containing protein n=1 Tax=Alkaliphilus pronyensis TaxID=1482732 RepID=A0A6I0FDE9_9FIRM|nr:PHP domain-containing protein [Alkaliphilus pronyensis]KAB3535925.1 PHP domain-containing protein [Alkaliphilus pronyensis]